MKKLVSLLISFSVISTLLFGCVSRVEKEASVAFTEKRYKDVLSILEDETIDDPEVMQIFVLSKAYVSYQSKEYHAVVELLDDYQSLLEQEFSDIYRYAQAAIAFESKNYESVVNILGIGPIKDSEIEKMLTYSRAVISYYAEEYENVINLLCDDSAYINDKIVVDSWKILFNRAVDNYDIGLFLEYCGMDAVPSSVAVESVLVKCREFDYDSFLFLDKLILELPNGDVKSALVSYKEESGKTRTKAFLKGTWEWQEDEEIKNIVELHVSEDDSQCVGYVKQVGTGWLNYHYSVGEVYWKDFVFEEDQLVNMYNQGKTTTGLVSGRTADVILYYDTNTMLLTLEVRDWYYNTYVNSPVRTWVKISNDYIKTE